MVQIVSERYHLQPQPIKPSNVKWKMHRLGLVAALVQLALNVDSFGIDGIWGQRDVYLFHANMYCLLATMLVVVSLATATAVYKSKFSSLPAAVKYGSYSTVAMGFFLGNFCGLYGASVGKAWLIGVFLLYLAVLLMAFTGVFITTHAIILKHLDDANGNAGKVPRSVARQTISL